MYNFNLAISTLHFPFVWEVGLEITYVTGVQEAISKTMITLDYLVMKTNSN